MTDVQDAAGELARVATAVAGGSPLLGELAASAVRLAIAVVGRDKVQEILDAEYAAAEAVADASADALEAQKFGGGENTTAPATPEAKAKAK